MIWCSYRMTGRSHMSTTITARSPRALRLATRARRRPLRPALPRRNAERAEAAYLAELVHADRHHPAPARAVARAGEHVGSVRAGAGRPVGAVVRALSRRPRPQDTASEGAAG